jgi:hypothetical protein
MESPSMKTLQNSTLGAVLILGLGLTGCDDVIGVRGNGNVVTDQRDVTEFTEVESSGGLNVDWQSGPPHVSITTDENLLPYLKVDVSGHTLRISSTHRNLRPSLRTHGIRISISSAKLEGADVSGAVDLTAKNVTGPKFYVRGRGASDITIDGAVDEFLLDVTGASDVRAQGLQTKTTEISSTGASSARVTATETLRVSITGAGDVMYYGHPKTVEKHVTGAGSIHKKD